MTVNEDRTIVEEVDDALDLYVESGRQLGAEPEAFVARVLAEKAGVGVTQMSHMLQMHRSAQTWATSPRYVVACEGYGPDAPWVILSKPGDDPETVQRARVDHAKWVARDQAKRLARDIVTEIAPALHGTARDNLIERLTRLLQDQVDVAVDFVVTSLDEAGT